MHVGKAESCAPGIEDPRVVSLRQRLNIAGDKDNPLYDDAVRDAVKTFQTEADIGVDGNLGPNTVRALNGEKKKVAKGPPPIRSTPSSSTWSAGAGCRAISAIRM